jgi:hypothetical protein
MKETGILFTPENHRAILNKTKWQTRRVINYQSTGKRPSIKNLPYWETTHGKGGVESFLCDPLPCPYGVPGDRLYVKEGIILHADGQTLAGYYRDGARITNLSEKRLTAMFMAKKYARTWLELTDVKVERLQDISEEDSIAEGITRNGDRYDSHVDGYSGWGSAKEAYKELWDSINQKKHPWSSNPWCWVLEFCVI